MAGLLFRSYLHSRTIQKRNPECYPNWTPSGPCVGDGHSAFQNITQTNCPDISSHSRTDCSSQMPFTCSIDTISLDSSVKTCGDCSSVPEGQSCFFVCSDQNATFTVFSLKSLLCLQSGWSQIPQLREPKCVASAPSCPPILSWNGLSTDHTSKCVGASIGDVCRVSCLPGYYSSNGWYDATCTRDYTWTRPLICDCQACGEFGDPSCGTSNNDNNFNYKYI
jgi:hypothetical protein